MDATTPNGSPALVAFIGGSAANAWSQRPSSERKEAVLANLVLLFGEAARTPLDYVEKDWAQEKYNGGCPVVVPRPGRYLHIPPFHNC
eukprot:m.141209 g.141209  ORF g.141209 m.141209 type:complete len:88 (+) comp14035_c0_seq27:1846-2109(+)